MGNSRKKNSKKDHAIAKIDPKVKDILKLLGAGVILTTVLLVPGIAAVGYFLKEDEREKWEKQKKEWEKFNTWRLKQIIKRLEKQKAVTIEQGIVKLTQKGKQKLLKFDLDTMASKKKRDGKWRLIIYDIAELKKDQRALFRSMLKRLRCLQIQRSVYLTPFICEDEIEFLRQTFGIGRDVLVAKVSEIENEEAYRRYFGI